MTLMVVGLSHKTAPVELRERLAFPEKRMEEPLLSLKEYTEVGENVIVSTCNRVEVYSEVKKGTDGEFLLKDFMASYHQLPLNRFDEHLYCLIDSNCVNHAFRVAASLDSMIVGEVQILGQVKEAFDVARRAGCTGPILNQLFERAFFVAKKVRSETGIAKNAVSISYAAVELAKKIFSDLNGKSVMLVGAGEMAELAARHLVSNGVSTVMVSNRTFDRAVKLAQELNGSAVRFERFPQELAHADIVISSTGAPHQIITRKLVKAAIRARKNRPVFLIDIAVPRDIEPEVNDLENVYLYDIDDLENVIQYNIREREREAQQAESIINHEVEKFLQWHIGLDAVPTIISLRKKLESIRGEETAKARTQLKNISDDDFKVVEAMTNAILNKILHHPTTFLKKAGENSSADLVQTVRRLFKLEN